MNLELRIYSLVDTELVARYFERAAVAVLHMETTCYVGSDERAALKMVYVQGIEIPYNDFAIC